MTVRQIAEAAGVSITTVSLALRNHERVPLATRKLVAATARRLKYKKRGPGRPPRKDSDETSTYHSNRIALLVPGMHRAVLNSPIYMDVLHGVESAVAEHGKICVLRHLMPENPPPAILFPQKVDGVVLFGREVPPEIVQQLRDVPCVRMMGLSQTGVAWDHVTYDNRQIGPIAAEYLLSRGHRRLAILAPKPGEWPGAVADFHLARRDDFAKVVTNAGGRVAFYWDEPVLNLTATHQQPVRETFARMVDQLIATKPRPTALFVPLEILTTGLYPVLLEKGIKPGVDLEIISCNNEALLLQNLYPRPATIDIQALQVGRQAVERLLWRINNPQSLPGVVQLKPTLVVGQEVISLPSNSLVH